MKAAESETRRLVMVRRTGSLEGIRFSFGLVPINALDADRTDRLFWMVGNLPLQGYGRAVRYTIAIQKRRFKAADFGDNVVGARLKT